MNSFRKTFGALLLLSATLPASSQTRLAFNLPKGSTYLQRMDYDVDTEAEGQQVKMKIKGAYRVRVTGETDSTRILDVVYDRVGMDMDLGSMNISADSDVPVTLDLSDGANAASAVMGKMFAAMKGKSFQLTVNREGRVSTVAGIDALTEAVMASMDVPEDIKTGARAGFTKQFNENSIRQNFNQVFYILPGRAVKAGDSWQRSYDQEDSEVTTTYTIRTIDPRQTTIATSSVIRTTAPQKLEGTGSGELVVDTRTGLIIRGQLTNKLEGNATVTSRGTFEGSILENK